MTEDHLHILLLFCSFFSAQMFVGNFDFMIHVFVVVLCRKLQSGILISYLQLP